MLGEMGTFTTSCGFEFPRQIFCSCLSWFIAERTIVWNILNEWKARIMKRREKNKN